MPFFFFLTVNSSAQTFSELHNSVSIFYIAYLEKQLEQSLSLLLKTFPWLFVSLSKRQSPQSDLQGKAVCYLHCLPCPQLCSQFTELHDLFSIPCIQDTPALGFSLAVLLDICKLNSLTSKSWLNCYLLTEAYSDLTL